jgi:uncharacterized protein (TIGR02246 family)
VTNVRAERASPDGPAWLTPEQVAGYLALPSRKALYQAVRRGLVPGHRLGRLLRFYSGLRVRMLNRCAFRRRRAHHQDQRPTGMPPMTRSRTMTTPVRDDECVECQGTVTKDAFHGSCTQMGKLLRLALASIPLLCLAACASPGSAPPAPFECGVATHGNSARSANEEETAAANAMVTRFVDSWNRADGAAYGAGYWAEAELVDPTGTIHAGQAAIAQMHVDLWNSVFKGSVIHGSIRRITPLDRNFLLVDVDLALTQFKQLPAGGSAPQGLIKTHLKHLLEKRDGVWRIIAAQNTFVSEAPPKQAPTK